MTPEEEAPMPQMTRPEANPTSIDDAWAAVERALPDGWSLTVIQSFVRPRSYLVSAMNRRSSLRITEGLDDEDGAVVIEADSLTDALMQLAEAVRR